MEMITQQTLIDRQVGESMPTTKIKAFLREFPWVNDYIDGGICQVYVSRVEPELFYRKLKYVDVGGLEGAALVFEKAFLLDENHELVSLEKEGFYYRKKYFFFGPNILCKRTIKITGEVKNTSIKSVLDKMGERAESVYYILSYWEHTGGVIVYKSPKGMSIPEWIEKQIASERANFQKELAEIDAEA